MPGKILILDSVPTNRIVLKVKLSTAFYQVVLASSLQDARLLIRRGAPARERQPPCPGFARHFFYPCADPLLPSSRKS